MAVLVLDASAVVKYYVLEPGSTWIREVIDAKSEPTGLGLYTVIIADVSVAEVASAFSVLHRTGRLRRRACDAAFDRFMDDVLRRYSLAGSGRDRFYDAARLTQRHPLKAYDAVQLAVAMQQNKSLLTVGQTLTFVSGDHTLLTAAVAEGLAVDNSFEHASPEDLPAASK